MVLAGYILGFLFLFGWVPYMGLCLGRGIKFVLFSKKPSKPEKKVPPQKVTKEKAVKEKVVKPRTRTKSSYPVHASFREEHRITNPVEFDA
tara:strand:- start:62 stop:334 length:273 start_codon:yes stop_codon:yes gene_type:complete